MIPLRPQVAVWSQLAFSLEKIMKTQPKIVVVGSSNTDMIVKSKHLPKPGETVIGGTFSCVAGGKGANQAVAAARLGADVTFIAKLGQDVFGDKALEGYHKEGIDTNWIRRDPQQATGVALILVDDNGENLISVASGANLFLSVEDVSKAGDVIEAADIVVSQLETPMETLVFTAELAAKHGVPMILDPAPAPETPLPSELLSKLYCIKPNENEAYRLTGVEVTDAKSAQKAADVLLEKGARSVIVTLGTQGALVCERNSQGAGRGVLVPAHVVKAVDTTAAGDCFSGALAVGLASGMSLVDAARLGVKASALSVMKLGAQPSLPTMQEVEGFGG